MTSRAQHSVRQILVGQSLASSSSATGVIQPVVQPTFGKLSTRLVTSVGSTCTVGSSNATCVHLLKPLDVAKRGVSSYVSLGRYEPNGDDDAAKERGQLHLQQLMQVLTQGKKEDMTMDDVISRVDAFMTLGRHYHHSGEVVRAKGYYEKGLEECKELVAARDLYLNDLYGNDPGTKEVAVSTGGLPAVIGGIRKARSIIDDVKTNIKTQIRDLFIAKEEKVVPEFRKRQLKEVAERESKMSSCTSSNEKPDKPKTEIEMMLSQAVQDAKKAAGKEDGKGAAKAEEKKSGDAVVAASENGVATQENAEEFSEEALRMNTLKWLESLPTEFMLTECETAMGLILVEEESFEEAEQYLTRALNKRKAMGERCEKSALAEAYNNLGCCLQCRGAHQKALDYHEIAMQKLLEFYEEGESNRYVTLTYFNLGLCRASLGKGGVDDLERAYDLAEHVFQTGDPFRENIRKTLESIKPKQYSVKTIEVDEDEVEHTLPLDNPNALRKKPDPNIPTGPLTGGRVAA